MKNIKDQIPMIRKIWLEIDKYVHAEVRFEVWNKMESAVSRAVIARIALPIDKEIIGTD